MLKASHHNIGSVMYPEGSAYDGHCHFQTHTGGTELSFTTEYNLSRKQIK